MKSVIDRKLGGRGVRRSESLHHADHSRSVGDLYSASPSISLLRSELESNEMFLSRQQRGAEVVSEEEEERGGEEEVNDERAEMKKQQSMNKSRSMDFFKAKLLNIKNRAINNHSNYNINSHR